MSVSISANITIFDKFTLDVTPNPKVPTRIESASGFTLKKTDVTDIETIFPIPKEIGAAFPDKVDVSQIVIDTKTKEFQMGIHITPGANFFLNSFSKILTINKLDVFVSSQPCPKP